MRQAILTLACDNGAKIEVLYYDEPLAGEYPLDRIHVLITPAGEQARGWVMTPGEANALKGGLDLALARAQQDGMTLEDWWCVTS